MPEADFQQISEFLSRGGYDPATEELLDFVWCSPWLCFRQPDPAPVPPEPPKPPEPPPRDEEEPAKLDRPSPDPAPPPPPKLPAPGPEIPVPKGIGKEEDRRQDVGLEAAGSASPARRVRLAGARPFREALSLTDALRPLRFGVPEATGQLDEEGTAEILARTGLLLPCWESHKVSPFRIEVVVESTRGVLFWSAWVRHWVELLRQATRSRVILSYLTPVADGDSETRRHPFVLSPSWPAERGAHPETLGYPGCKRLIFLFTDMMSPLWKEDGPMPALLREWSRHQTVTVLNPLHRDIWIDSAWARADRGFAHCRELGRVRWLNVSGTSVPEKSSPVFHLRLTASAVGNWARTVTARAAVGHPALTWKVPTIPAKPRPVPPAPVPEPLSLAEFQERVQEAEAGLLTPSGLALLRVLTAAPLTPAIMRLVQRSIYPSLGHEQLSEIHRSGLLYRLPGQRESKDPDRVHYDFLPVRAPDGTVQENALRDHFFNQAGWDRVDEVRELVGDFIARQHGLDSWSVAALERAKENDGDASAEELRPFARVMGHVLGRFGERFAAEAMEFSAWGRGGAAVLEATLIDELSNMPGTEEVDTSCADDRPATLINSIGMTMLGIAPGTFTMGCPADEPGRDRDDFPQHEVTLTHPFWIAHTPVTQKQWSAIMGTSVADQRAKGESYGDVTGTGDDHPVYFVNWKDALRFCDRLTERENRRAEGLAYALPTEAQWEYACRAGTNGSHNVPGAEAIELGWFRDNSEHSTHPVGTKTPNAWGLHDCHGNVWEWCADWFKQSPITELALDPQGLQNSGYRVLRGGSWSNNAQTCRSARRYWYAPGLRYENFGFRPVLCPVKQREAQGALPPEPEAAAKPEPEVQEEAARSVRPHFVPIKAGTFLMGSPKNEKGRLDREDLHQVTLTRDFEIADTPVTQAQYEAEMGNNPRRFKESHPDAPVEQVSWEDAVAFCEKLSTEDSDWVYRLPTEAEWEYACRAGTTGPYNVEGASLDELGWFAGNADLKTHPVRTKRPNNLGLYDCHGNVHEWCQDWYSYVFGTEDVTDPQGPKGGGIRVLRGGSWSLEAQYCRSACRDWDTPDSRSTDIGFRPVRTKKAKGTALETAAEPEPEAGARSSAWIARDFVVPAAPGMKMLCLGPGDFLMGEGTEAHSVTLNEDFFIAETPVTQAQYQAVMRTNPSYFKNVSPEAPVERISWEDAMAFCARLNERYSRSRPRIFLSHAREDISVARRLEQILKGFGFEVVAVFDVTGLGGSLVELIESKIRECDAIVAVVSREGNSRRDGWHHREVEFGIAHARLHGASTPFVIPVFLSDFRPTDGLLAGLPGIAWTGDDSASRLRDVLEQATSPSNPLRPGWTFSLPTEIQWEYACRAGTKTAFSFGDALNGTQANCDGSVPFGTNEQGPNLQRTSPVKSYPANQWGLYDCHGNVWEWCLDRDGEFRALRGGCWNIEAELCQSGTQNRDVAGATRDYIGFRPVVVRKKETAGPAVVARPEHQDTASQNLTARAPVEVIRFVRVPARKSGIGSPPSDPATGEGEVQHDVTFGQPFEIADTPITQAQYESVMGTNPSHFKQSGANAPVERVNWEEAQEWCRKMSAQDAEYDYRLPTEAEWEYACRAGTGGPYNVDGVSLDELGWYEGNSDSKTHPVKQKQPNRWGLYDCHGNVWEWCSDWHEPPALRQSVGLDHGVHRLRRGGSWGEPGEGCRSAERGYGFPTSRGGDTGFRPVRTKKVAADFANGLGMEMICLEPGTFTMGSPADEEGRESESWMGKETQHEVTLSAPFWIAKTPVTQRAWWNLTGTSVADQKAKGSDFGDVTGTGEHHPVYFVSWAEALAACDQLSIREREAGRLPEGYLYTLPTEAQWEYACRGGTKGAFNVDGASLHDLGWYSGNSGVSTHQVGEKAPNAWGLHDCHGNVWEWCADQYRDDLGVEAATDPQGLSRGANRVVRGGNFLNGKAICRASSRRETSPLNRYSGIGFRPVLASRKQRTDLSALPAELEVAVQPEPPAPPVQTKPEPPHPLQSPSEVPYRNLRDDGRPDLANPATLSMDPLPLSGRHAAQMDLDEGIQEKVVFVKILPGNFSMGSPMREKSRGENETLHRVTLTYAFEIAATPVTQAQYAEVVGVNPSQFREAGQHAPVEFVSWEDARQWCEKMTVRDSVYIYRLPTEAEWEYACRAGSIHPFSFGESLNGDHANCDGRHPYGTTEQGKYIGSTVAVQDYGPNAWNLFDCHGNVSEWCQDWYQEDLGTKAQKDPTGTKIGDKRVIRGGSWRDHAVSCRSGFRDGLIPIARCSYVGFRPVRVLREPTQDNSGKRWLSRLLGRR